MPSPDLSRLLAECERDGVVVVWQNAELAAEVRARGWPVASIARIEQLHDAFRAAWRRVAAVLCIECPPEVVEAANLLTRAMGTNVNTGRTRATPWARNVLANVPRAMASPLALSARYPGLPAFIVGAGPSLDRNRHHIDGDRGVVITCNAASHSVEAHYEACMEAHSMVHKLAGRGVGLLALQAHPKTWKHYRQVQWFHCGELGEDFEELTAYPTVTGTASVTTTAIEIARRWGCAPIILVGQDLGWTDGHVYAGSTGFGDSRVIGDRYQWGRAMKAKRVAPLPEAEPMDTVAGWGGGPAVTCTMAHQSIAEWIGRKATEVEIINCTEGGRSIEGVPEMRLRDAVAQIHGRQPLQEPRSARHVPPEAWRNWLVDTDHRGRLFDHFAHAAVADLLERDRFHPKGLERLKGLLDGQWDEFSRVLSQLPRPEVHSRRSA